MLAKWLGRQVILLAEEKTVLTVVFALLTTMHKNYVIIVDEPKGKRLSTWH